jgi:hypothetical protein
MRKFFFHRLRLPKAGRGDKNREGKKKRTVLGMATLTDVEE